MKRNMNLIREILLSVENLPGGKASNQISLPDGEWSPDEVIGHLRLVYDAGYIDGKIHFNPGGLFMTIYGLTNAGHDLLDSIRDETVWNKTKEEVGKVGGTVAVDTLKSIAAAITVKLLGL